MRGGLTLRVLGASVLLALVVGASFTVLLRAIFAQRDSASLAMHSQEVLASANRLERLVIDIESGLRGYLLTRQERFLDPWTAARAALPRAEARLRGLAEVPAQHARAVALTHQIDSYVEDYSVPLVADARAGGQSARSVGVAVEGLRRINQIRAGFDGLETAERALAAQRNASSVATAHRAVAAAATGLAISVVLILLLALYLTRAIVRPVRRAASMADQLAGGDLATRIPETAVGEIRQLEHSFNEMGGSLERGRDELSRLLAEQAALRRVATLVAHGQPPGLVFTAVVEEAGRVLGVDGARMLRREADATATVVATWGALGPGSPELGARVPLEELFIAGRVMNTGRPARRDLPADVENRRDSMSTVGAPIIVEGTVWGVMVTLSAEDTPLPEAERRLAQFTDLVATAVANSQARADLAASRARLVAASDEARHRIERDLHDGTQQRLVSLALDVRAAEASVPDGLPEVRAQLSAIVDGLSAALDDLREISRGIHPAILSEGGLGPALNALVRRSGLPVEVTSRISTRLGGRGGDRGLLRGGGGVDERREARRRVHRPGRGDSARRPAGRQRAGRAARHRDPR